MTRRTWIGMGVIGALVGLVSQLPLSWIGSAVPQEGLPAPLEFTGTVWQGQITGLPLTGPLSIETSPAKLITGGTPFTLQSRAPGISLNGRAGFSQVQDLAYRADFAVLPITDGRLVNLAGNIDVRIEEAKFGQIGCESLTGTVRTDVLGRNQARLNWSGPDLSGPLSCENGEIVAALAGQDGRTDINAVLRVNVSGSYRLETTVTSRDPEAAVLLPLYGFQGNGNRYSLTEQGQW